MQHRRTPALHLLVRMLVLLLLPHAPLRVRCVFLLLTLNLCRWYRSLCQNITASCITDITGYSAACSRSLHDMGAPNDRSKRAEMKMELVRQHQSSRRSSLRAPGQRRESEPATRQAAPDPMRPRTSPG